MLAFTEDAAPANEVLVRVADYRGVNTELRFSTAGFTRAFERLGCADYLDTAG
jgi:hypothetical protein